MSIASLKVTQNTSLTDLQLLLNQGAGNAKVYGKKDADQNITLYLKPKATGVGKLTSKIKSLFESAVGIAANRRAYAKQGLDQIMLSANNKTLELIQNNRVLGNENHTTVFDSTEQILSGLASQTKGHRLQDNEYYDNKANRVNQMSNVVKAMLEISQKSQLLSPELVINKPQPQSVSTQINELVEKHHLALIKPEKGEPRFEHTTIFGTTVATPIMIGEVKYNPTGRLGSGGFGDVYLYKQEGNREGFDKHVVVKIANSSDPEKTKAAFNEIKKHALVQEKSPESVIGLKGALEMPNGHVGIVSEYSSYGDLQQLSSKLHSCIAEEGQHPKEGQITRKQASIIALTLIEDMVKGLQSLHTSSKVTHFDFKNPNVLINEDGEGKIADFGTTFVGEENHISQTEKIESGAYKAPELCYASQTYTSNHENLDKKVILDKKSITKNLAQVYPHLKKEDLKDIATNVLTSRSEVLYHEMHVDVKITNTQKMDVWGLGASALELFTGKTVLNDLKVTVSGEKATGETAREGFLSKFSKEGGDAIAPVGTENVYEKHLSESTGNMEIDGFLNSLLKAKPEERPDFKSILGDDIFLQAGIGSPQARELIKNIVLGDKTGIDNASIQFARVI